MSGNTQQTSVLPRLSVHDAEPLAGSDARDAQDLYSSLGVGSWKWDIPRGTVRLDPQWRKRLHFSKSRNGVDILEWEKTFHPNDMGAIRLFLEAMRNGEPSNPELKVRLSSGDSWSRVLIKGRVTGRDSFGKGLQAEGVLVDLGIWEDTADDCETLSQKIKSFYESCPLAIIGLNPERKVVGWNPAAETIFGWREDEILGQDYPIVPPDKQAEYESLISKGLKGNGEPHFKRRIRRRRKDGSLVDLNFYAFTIRNRDGELIEHMGLYDDITENLRTRDLLETALDSMADAVLVVEYGENARRIVSCNAAVEIVFGYSPEELIGRSTEFLYANREEYEKLGRESLDALEKSQRFKKECRMRRKDGVLIYTENSLSNLADRGQGSRTVVGVVRDITESKRTDAALRESRNLLQSVLDTIPVRVFWKDLDLKFMGCNKPFASDAGFDNPEDLTGKDDYQMPWKEQAELYRRDDFEVIASGKAKINFEEMQTTPGGETKWLLTSKIPLKDANGALNGVLATYEDITERKQAGVEREKLQAQLTQAQKMESIGRLAGGVAHDFNNILAAIIGYADMLMLRMPQTDPLRKDAQEILRAGERARDLTRQLLAFSRKQVLQMKVLDINETVSALARMLHRLIGENIELKLVLSPQTGNVRADSSQLDQVMLNLVVNARDAMQDGGRILIETSIVCLGEEYCREHTEVTPGEYVMLAVSDNGQGMSREVLSHIFEPFYTTKEHGKGTGLGLSTVYGIICQHGGSIWVYSEPGHGTVFKIYLPRVNEQIESDAVLQEHAETTPAGGVVLLCEDDEMVRKVAAEALGLAGYEVMAASNPDIAREMARSDKMHFDMLLTDVILPGINGIKLYEELKKLNPALRVLYMSGYTDEMVELQGGFTRGAGFIQKPFSIKDFLDKVRDTLAG